MDKTSLTIDDDNNLSLTYYFIPMPESGEGRRAGEASLCSGRLESLFTLQTVRDSTGAM